MKTLVDRRVLTFSSGCGPICFLSFSRKYCLPAGAGLDMGGAKIREKVSATYA